MKNPHVHVSGKIRRAVLLTISGLPLLFGAPAFGQANSEGTTTNSDQPVKLENFVVTGSYLPTSVTVGASPVVTIQSSDVGQSGATDPLRLLRQLTPFFAGSGNIGTEANNGLAGESYVALRNLTTLTLLNGQRITTSPFSASFAPAVDLNIIPTAMIDRVEILKDGASTIYGTDAIGGVVNIILKKDFNGFETGVRYGTTKNGDYKTREGYIIGGASSDTYSITVAAQHFENTQLKTTDRPLTTLTPADEAAMGFNPTSAVFSGSYAGRVGSDVLAGSTEIATGAPGFNAAILSPGIKSSPNAPPMTLAQLEAAGVYIPVSSTPAGQAAGSATALNTTLFGNPLIEATKRNQFVGNGTKQLYGKNLEFFGDFLFSQTTNTGSGLAPAPIAGVGPGGGNALFIPANNPYNVFGVDFPGPLAARTRLEELGLRNSVNETNTFRFVGGFKGEINDQYGWEAVYNYSRASLLSRIFGGANGANMNTAMIPLLDATGNYVYNSAGKPLSILTDAQGNNLPVYNFFALPGFNDPATLDAIRTTLFESGDTSLRNVQFIFHGKPFALPAGDLSFALGLEGRAEDTTASVDALFANGLALGFNPAKTFSGGSRSSRGAFIEVGIPVTNASQNIAGLHSLDLNVADRYEKIEPGGNANSPKFGIKWLPFDDTLTIRATFAKGFIAPSIFSLFGPATGNSPTFNVLQGDGSAGAGGSLGNIVTIQGNTNQLSNPNLLASTSKSWTAGIVYSPKQVRGLSFTIDYYHIFQDKVGTIDYTSVVADLNAKGSASVYAPGMVFADGSHLASTAPNQVTSTNFGTLTIANNPAGDQWTDGLDVGVDYRFATESLGHWAIGAQANILFNYKARATEDDPYLQYARNFTDGTNGGAFPNGLLPGYIIKPYVTQSIGRWTTSVYLNYIPSTPALGSLLLDPTDPNTDRIDGKAYHIPSYFSADVAVTCELPNFGRKWARNVDVTVGLNNAFDKKPPYVPVDGNPPGENNTVESTYDIIGRFFFVQLKKTF
ncbi:MAG TPA: TonB-dependent receptor [Candidatus Didemnitutus sp.]|nr:TonB-dependent receptor [Candidatus Didemnitutus sp.]